MSYVDPQSFIRKKSASSAAFPSCLFFKHCATLIVLDDQAFESNSKKKKHRNRQRIVCYRNCLYYPYKFSISVRHTYSVLSGQPGVSVQHVPMSLSQCEHTHPTCRARAGTTADTSSINTEIQKFIKKSNFQFRSFRS